MGVDAMQALLLALAKLGSDVYTSEESRARRLRWSGNENGNLGLLVHRDTVGELVPEPRETWVI
jgi:hypothetical protein